MTGSTGDERAGSYAERWAAVADSAATELLNRPEWIARTRMAERVAALAHSATGHYW